MVRLSRAFCRRGLFGQWRSAFCAGNLRQQISNPVRAAARSRRVLGAGQRDLGLVQLHHWRRAAAPFLPALPPPPTITLATLLGVLVMAILLSLHFGRVRNSAPHP
jgi:hypothetical protein